MFDVRFAWDSLFERFCKLLHLGIMIGFAVAGPGFTFDIEGDPIAWLSLRRISLLLMAARLILCGQYGIMLLFVRARTHLRIPLMLRMLQFFTAAMVFLGLTFTFKPGSTLRGWTGWFVVFVVEGAVSATLPLYFEALVTNYNLLMQRLGLLTLIILGEGVIGITVQLARVLGVGVDLNTFVGATVSAVVIVVRPISDLLLILSYLTICCRD